MSNKLSLKKRLLIGFTWGVVTGGLQTLTMAMFNLTGLIYEIFWLSTAILSLILLSNYFAKFSEQE